MNDSHVSNFFDSSIVMSHDIKNVLVHTSHLQLGTRRSVFPWVVVDPDPASRFREVSAALLCLNDLHCVSFPIQNIDSCILDADASVAHNEFPYYLIRLHEFLIALPWYIYFNHFFVIISISCSANITICAIVICINLSH